MGFTTIIPAAGQGKRMGTEINKLFLEVDGETIIRRTVSVFQEIEKCEQIFIAAHPNEVHLMEEHLKDFSKVAGVIPGGKERQHSINEVLKVLIDTEVVMVHDGARPFITHEKINQLYQETLKNNAVILAVQAKDTIKRVIDGVVEETYDRATMFQVQTPQSFSRNVILQAYNLAEKDGFIGTDDASLVERAGYKVHITNGDYDNIKITTHEDLIIADSILERRGNCDV
ncbi:MULTISPECIES: 2-C-methyl-D-erythritol 4-phosphate cytidylyltransferase [Mammaliicoccus]|uniref:2-C-methyl-D-erythritol 4-phosphate cytidylyltransferase n=1 Tax=Mammaliicoccus vitulinus TaxID=71237 RepID=A0A2T4PSE7_9STAP|nr:MULTISPECIES: 2-C-methyl-D-erythritol 4-phosphate cytidylyltransferase [Mammaliicoccus]MBM6629717.1 2-C-methyl-D-erythritol 4-phosphate cytidylyltransferase [Mammaliicoccus vitulinus]MBO3075945.1 2-C-methyl-D-erythritol 4-phosphate cytidylyltransferase [Mammaliicoccus vitulinus]MEB7658601.1 2-C-methyl-D-erythritol 4-phosphate cytidylyltransferase [Mammaliicoccus vitulinus]PNZ41218.1 2-C-methyl-D-erythritol 4-phosphate cytidylyltransferase [Mammaliicoccus vitulinus]PTI29238.1 2-C-methyl-D-er